MFMVSPRVFLCALMILPLISTTAAAAQPSRQPANTSFSVYLPNVMVPLPTPSIEQQVVELANQERRRSGCAVALTLSPKLSEAARAHSQDMAANDFFGHTGSDGSSLATRIQRVGYAFSAAAENIAAGYATAQSVVDSWMRSPEHRANILNCSLREVGVGYYDQAVDQPNVRIGNGTIGGPFHYYWTQDFGTPRHN
jgi:uncharacterized protein YkwD